MCLCTAVRPAGLICHIKFSLWWCSLHVPKLLDLVNAFKRYKQKYALAPLFWTTRYTVNWTRRCCYRPILALWRCCHVFQRSQFQALYKNSSSMQTDDLHRQKFLPELSIWIQRSDAHHVGCTSGTGSVPGKSRWLSFWPDSTWQLQISEEEGYVSLCNFN